MSWQDVVLCVGGIVGAIALFPSILSDDKPATATSVMNGSIAVAITVVDLSLHLLYAAAIAIVITVLWFILATQQWDRHHRRKHRLRHPFPHGCSRSRDRRRKRFWGQYSGCRGRPDRVNLRYSALSVSL
jgi:hypothetical protein